MNPKDIILLPGTEKQVQLLLAHVKEEIKNILVIGSGTVKPGLILRDNFKASVFQIVEDEDSLLTDRLRIKGEPDINVRLMDFENTDFKKEQFDLIYAQASVSEKRRSRIVKEVRRILKPGGIFCVGEITNTGSDTPPYIKDVWDTSAISPLAEADLAPFYTSRNFELLFEKDLQPTLTEYYSIQSDLLPGLIEELAPNEKSYYKKLLNRMSHEANVYLKLGGHKHIGFRMLILRKKE